jgi:S1-C subfamily serine protease
VNKARPSQVSDAVARAGASVVEIVGVGCGDVQEGSGFAVSPDLVVTNAHVVAGVPQPDVVLRSGSEVAAKVVLFDSHFDLAVLQVSGLDVKPLQLDPKDVGRSTSAAVLGYPGGGGFSAVPAGVMADIDAWGQDIYGKGITLRDIYEIQAEVIPGNSGGPLVLPSGEVIGVVYSRSISDSKVGYALASPGVLSRVRSAEQDSAAVSTGACVN